ncbi:MAG: MmgE/PrpD family protein [Burkholderiales bacterium]|nr:MmgE/PrpD family protein [Burkholderiales bacterium]
MTGVTATGTVADTLAAFALGLDYAAIPQRSRDRAKLLVLDAIGVAFASASYDFGRRTAQALAEFGTGDAAVIGLPQRLALRDAVLANGVLVHGLDYDDTSIAGRVHPSSAVLPCALGMAAHLHASGRDLLLAYVLGMEASIRIGAVAKGGFQAAGWHPTGIAGSFGSALLAGRLLGLDRRQLVMAQGVVASTAAGTREFVPEAAWTKRMHAGWAGASGITAAMLARHGFTGPTRAYEGGYGLYRTYLGARYDPADLALATASLGERWEIEHVSLKPMPSCYFTHGCLDAAAALMRDQGLRAEDVESITALIPQAAVDMVCEPRAAKRRPADSYGAQFSLYYAIACMLVKGHATLTDHEPPALTDPAILALADRIDYAVDRESNFPAQYSGALIVRTRAGRELSARVDVNRGSPQLPLSSAEISAKFHDNATRVVSASQAHAIETMVLDLDRLADASALSRALGTAA